MPNKNYQAGVRFERLRMKHWESLGSWCLRSAGSHGAFDIVVIKQYSGEVYFIQCKIVQTLKEAERMIEKFKAHPPYGKNVKQRYTQMLEVWVKEEKQVVGGWV